jgi:predicted alpha/beta-hydrolase family hydrolase
MPPVVAALGAGMPDHARIDVTPTEHTTATIYPAAGDRTGISLILAHGAGSNQASPFMVRFAGALAVRGIDVITFNFLYSEQRKRVPDRNDKLEACWRKVIEAFHAGAFGGYPNAPFVGGRSMGGRIASQVVAADDVKVSGLVLLGYPLHPPGRPDKLRSQHLPAIKVPMLFVQGSRDAFGTPDELRPLLKGLAAPVELRIVEGGDHSYKVPKKVMPPERVDEFVLDAVDRWLRGRV